MLEPFRKLVFVALKDLGFGIFRVADTIVFVVVGLLIVIIGRGSV